MDTPAESPVEPVEPPGPAVSRRGFLRTAGAVSVAGMAATMAACQATAAPSWAFASAAVATPTPTPVPATPEPSASGPAPSPSAPPIPNLPPGWTEHEYNAQVRVRRFVGNLAGPLGMSPFLDNVLGPNTDDPEFTKVTQGNQPLPPVSLDVDGTKVFALTIDEIDWQIDALLPPVKALGFNETWPGPTIRVLEGERVRISFTNNLTSPTGIHFHGLDLAEFTQDGVPFFTQLPIVPGDTFTYEFTATPAGSHMYHSLYDATNQVGRGLLGAFIVEPRRPADRYPRKYGVTQEVVFIHGDVLGGFTINGHGFPATTPIVAKQGDKVLIRFMNEGVSTHPWHTHGYRMNVVARDGAPLGTAAFKADTLGVNPGERWDAIIDCDRPGVWPIHCHVLPNDDGQDGMFGMVTALVILAPDAT